MATYNLGKFLLTPKGTYSSNTVYSRLDFVLYNGSSYVCKADNTSGKVPTNTTYWQLLANAGQPTMTEQQKQEIIQTLLDQGVIIDSNYNTFTTEEKEKLAGLTQPQNGVLTIKRNNNTVATFGADTSTNTTCNISVPVYSTDLNDGGTLWRNLTYAEPNTNTSWNISRLDQHTCYTSTASIVDLKIDAYSYNVNDVKNYCMQPTRIVFKAAADFDMTLPANANFNSKRCSNGKVHLLEVVNDLFTLTTFSV